MDSEQIIQPLELTAKTIPLRLSGSYVEALAAFRALDEILMASDREVMRIEMARLDAEFMGADVPTIVDKRG